MSLTKKPFQELSKKTDYNKALNVAQNSRHIFRTAGIGISLDVVNTLLRVKNNSPAQEYLRIINKVDSSFQPPEFQLFTEKPPDTFTEAKQREEGTLATFSYAAMDKEIRTQHKAVSNEWTVRGKTPGGVEWFETKEFWHAIINRSFSRLAKEPAYEILKPIVADQGKLTRTIFPAIFDCFATKEPYELFPDAEATMDFLDRQRRLPGENHDGIVLDVPLQKVCAITNFDFRIHSVLKDFGFADKFDQIISLQEMKKPKPHLHGLWDLCVTPFEKQFLETRCDMPLLSESIIGRSGVKRHRMWMHVGDSKVDETMCNGVGVYFLPCDASRGIDVRDVRGFLSQLDGTIEM